MAANQAGQLRASTSNIIPKHPPRRPNLKELMKKNTATLVYMILALTLLAAPACSQVEKALEDLPHPVLNVISPEPDELTAEAETAEALAQTPPPTATHEPFYGHAQATPRASLTPMPVGTYKHFLDIDGLERSYWLQVPPDLDPAHAVPVVFLFHGYREPAGEFNMSNFKEMAYISGFLLVTPNGSGPLDDIAWDAGGCCGIAAEEGVDEEAFIRGIMADLEQYFILDSKRIYATGYSNGGMLSYRLACEMSEVFAAIAPVSATQFYEPCQPTQPVSILHVHGLADPIVPYEGGGELLPVTFPPVEEGLQFWLDYNGCEGEPTQEQIWPSTTHTVYDACQLNTSVETYFLEYHNHDKLKTDTFRLAEVTWQFFLEHPKP